MQDRRHLVVLVNRRGRDRRGSQVSRSSTKLRDEELVQPARDKRQPREPPARQSVRLFIIKRIHLQPVGSARAPWRTGYGVYIYTRYYSITHEPHTL